jgi:rod shape-determining protein MreD
MPLFIALISFFLDGLLSIYQGSINIISFRPTFSLVALILIYPMFYKKAYQYYKICLLIGLAYDVIYTNTLMLNMILFPIMGFVAYHLFTYFSNNFIMSIGINCFIILLYHTVTYLILVLINYLTFDTYTFLYNIPGLLLTNTIFYIVVKGLLKISFKKKRYW